MSSNIFMRAYNCGLPIVVLCAWLSLFCDVGFAQPQSSRVSKDLTRIDLGQKMVASRACGIYALAGALKVLNVDFALDDILQTEYISDKRGSSIDDLCRAAQEVGVYAIPRKKLSIHALMSSSNPMILHLNRTQGLRTVPHWVLFLGIDSSGAAIIFDAPNPPTSVGIADLLTEWDGVAIDISKHPKNRFNDMALIVVEKWWLLALLVVIISIKPFENNWLQGWPYFKSIIRIGTLLLVILFSAYAYHVTAKTGFLRNASSIATIAKRHLSVSLPRFPLQNLIDMDQQSSIGNNARIALVDARPPEAFAWKTIPGSINVPVNSTTAEFAKAVESLRGKEQVVVFCQSVHCNWGELVAAHLTFSGINNVSVLDGGVNEWVEYFERN
ncbi:MAG TPA: rhodanese-like domain-containing protein [Pirellulaceae bacterium]|nr:rhodanese-like domain-containing protein [Pirellulaceae bacterium]HMO93311.1 rhodanese-like domain-containing protein [Pirellulaceae bacterium]HMP69150.1 rhodanese-like domain-containing protein [Pirellulaceae bacterium]